MCGILGIISPEPLDENLLIKARDTLSHRGPDDAGIWLEKSFGVYLAHRRLSILDLRPEGKQPMEDFQKRAVISFNGEIYNYNELRKTLEKRGHKFLTRTDTEVLLASYLEWGPDCVHKLNGMWAFAIYDKKKKIIFLSRDRAGKKPLYYVLEGEKFAFASQIKALKVFPGFSWRINLRALNYYLALGYIPGEHCFYSPAHKLPAGHSAIYDITNRHFSKLPYWQPPRFEENENINTKILLENLEELITESVALRLEADVPVGILLSGGVDSSIIAAVATKIKGAKNVKTFCIKMPDKRLDESYYAKRVADHLGTQHFELTVPSEIFESIYLLPEYVDEPLADSSILPTFILSKLVHNHVTVALGGDGGDELFGGYEHYLTTQNLSESLGWIPKNILKLVGKFSGRFLPLGIKGRNFIYSIREGFDKRWLLSMPFFDPWSRIQFFKKEILEELGENLTEPENYILSSFEPERGKIDRMLVADFKTFLTDDVLTKVDRASMAVSLEVRSPWLDKAIIEFAYQKIPGKLKLNKNNRRILQTILAEKILPGILNTGRKQGFSIPLGDWIRNQEKVLLIIRSAIKESNIYNYCNEAVIEKLLKTQIKGYRNESRLFALSMLRM